MCCYTFKQCCYRTVIRAQIRHSCLLQYFKSCTLAHPDRDTKNHFVTLRTAFPWSSPQVWHCSIRMAACCFAALCTECCKKFVLATQAVWDGRQRTLPHSKGKHSLLNMILLPLTNSVTYQQGLLATTCNTSVSLCITLPTMAINTTHGNPSFFAT